MRVTRHSSLITSCRKFHLFAIRVQTSGRCPSCFRYGGTIGILGKRAVTLFSRRGKIVVIDSEGRRFFLGMLIYGLNKGVTFICIHHDGYIWLASVWRQIIVTLKIGVVLVGTFSLRPRQNPSTRVPMIYLGSINYWSIVVIVTNKIGS